MQPLPFEQARSAVVEAIGCSTPTLELVPLEACDGRVLARDVVADRAYPPLPRSIRDGFAVRSTDVPGTLRLTGEIRAGQPPTGHVGSGECIEIMTGAGVPSGADAVVMVEYVKRDGDRIVFDRTASPGDFIVPAGSEAAEAATVLEAGTRLTYCSVAALASTGTAEVPVFRRPEIAIVATGDEIVPVSASPLPHQIRNSNSFTLAGQVRRAGAVARILPVARDEYASTRERIEDGLNSDLLLLSGGVSAGKYDIVENVLADLGAEFYFDRVLIQPGQPLVFGRIRRTFFFGLPGNPASTMVTFELFARAAIDLLSGIRQPQWQLFLARLTRDFRHKTGLTRFLPAGLSACGRDVTPAMWQGSGDVFAIARTNSYLVARPDRESWAAGELIEVLPR